MVGDLSQLETVERLIRKGHYNGPLVLNYVAIGSGAAGTHPADLIEFARRVPDGAVLTIESVMRNVAPFNAIAIALGLHVRVGIEDNLWSRKGERMTSVQQVEQMVRIANELHRDVATGPEAKAIYQIGTFYQSTDETLRKLGYASLGWVVGGSFAALFIDLLPWKFSTDQPAHTDHNPPTSHNVEE